MLANCKFNVAITANGSLDEDQELSELSSSVHGPEQRLEPADNTHRGMKYYIHMISGQVSPLRDY